MAINEEVYKNLGLKGFLGALPERIYKHLGSLGHVGTISDRLFKEGGYLSYITNLLGVVSRYFVTLDPVLNSHYEMAAPITFAGDFEIEVEFSTTTSQNHQMLISGISNTEYLALLSDGTLQLRLQNYQESTTTILNDGKLHAVKVAKVNGVVNVFINNILEISAPQNTNVTISNYIGKWYNGSFPFEGIIANAKFTDKSGASDVVTTFKLDQVTANTESSVEGNNSVTYVNIPQSARELYSLEDDTWVGSNEVVVNGDFATDSDWDIGTGWTISGGKANAISQAAYSNLSQANVIQLGKTYEVTFTISNYINGFARILVGGMTNVGDGTSRSGNGTYTENIESDGTRFYIRGDSFTGSIDNVSIKEVLEVPS